MSRIRLDKMYIKKKINTINMFKEVLTLKIKINAIKVAKFSSVNRVM